ncbi:MAG: hypothetical protein HY901_38030, partial [Deltaproteobacteria bacterium]|nr:hypothetical protein [Deltaproteobacteria bacterium]
MSTITSLAKQLSADQIITRAEAQQIVDKAQKNGIVSAYEKRQIDTVLTEYKDQFEPGAADLLKALVAVAPPPPPPVEIVKPLPLSESGAARPVFVSSTGSLGSSDTLYEPADNIELGDALERAAELSDDGSANPFAKLSGDVRGKAIDKTIAALGQTAGLEVAQANQLRASVATALLALAEASPEPELQKKAIEAYAQQVKAEPH